MEQIVIFLIGSFCGFFIGAIAMFMAFAFYGLYSIAESKSKLEEFQKRVATKKQKAQ